MSLGSKNGGQKILNPVCGGPPTERLPMLPMTNCGPDGRILWSSATVVQLERILKLQKRIMRILTSSEYNDHHSHVLVLMHANFCLIKLTGIVVSYCIT